MAPIDISKRIPRTDEQRRAYCAMDDAFRDAMRAWIGRFPNGDGTVADAVENDIRERIYLESLRRLGDACNNYQATTPSHDD
jgi:hypothetical protein